MLSTVVNTSDPRNQREPERPHPCASLTHQLITMIAIGLVLVVATTMLPMDSVHAITHDARHAMGFPCH